MDNKGNNQKNITDIHTLLWKRKIASIFQNLLSFIEKHQANIQKMRTKALYNREKNRVEKSLQEKIESDPLAKKQENFYQQVFKADDLPPKLAENKHDQIIPAQKRSKPDPFKKEKQKLAEQEILKQAEKDKKEQEIMLKNQQKEENRKQRKIWSRKLQQRGKTGQLTFF